MLIYLGDANVLFDVSYSMHHTVRRRKLISYRLYGEALQYIPLETYRILRFALQTHDGKFSRLQFYVAHLKAVNISVRLLFEKVPFLTKSPRPTNSKF